MRYFFYAFRLSLVQRLRSRGIQVFLALALLIPLAAAVFPDGSSSAVVQVGLVLPRRGGEALQELLEERSSDLVQFLPADEETVDRMILSGNWDCGLVVPKDFQQRLERLDTKNLLIFKTGPGSTVYPLVQETVAACMMELMSPYIAESYLKEMGAEEEALEEKLEELSQSAQQVQVNLETLDGEAMDPLSMTATGIRRLLRGMAAVLVMVWSLYQAVDLGRWQETDTAIRLRSVCRQTQLLLPQISAAMMPVFLTGIVLIPWLSGGSAAAAAFAAFWAVLLGISLVVSRIRPLWQSIPVMMPFLAVSSLIFEPVLVDVSLLFPGLSAWTAWLPVSAFIRAADGSGSSLACMIAEAGGLLMLSFGMDWLKETVPIHKD